MGRFFFSVTEELNVYHLFCEAVFTFNGRLRPRSVELSFVGLRNAEPEGRERAGQEFIRNLKRLVQEALQTLL